MLVNAAHLRSGARWDAEVLTAIGADVADHVDGRIRTAVVRYRDIECRVATVVRVMSVAAR